MTYDGGRDVARSARELAARLPTQLRSFAELAFNYRWSWTLGGPGLFRTIDPERWTALQENPVRLLLESPPSVLRGAAKDQDLVARADSLLAEFRAEMSEPAAVGSADRPVVFLCAEYGIHRSLPIYSGGLGVLAGDLLKEASDQAIPLVAVGLLYRQGYGRQHVDHTGWQREYWVDTDPERLPAVLVTHAGLPITITVDLAGRPVQAQIWRVDVGGV